MDTVSNQEYKTMVEKTSPNSHLVSDCFRAFFVGGIICTLGHLLTNFFGHLGIPKETCSLLTSITLIAAGALLTGLGIYDKIGKFGGAGSVVPITGFSNSITAPAIEFKKEGYIFGVGAKMFIIVGPVIVYGILASVITGTAYFFLKHFGWN